MNLLITGANGMLGRSVQKTARLKYKNYNLFTTDVKNLDITDAAQLQSFFEQNKINCIINCAAYTNVDACEKNEETAYKINADGAANLAVMSEKYKCRIIHISTDYVYNSDSLEPLAEDAELDPVSVYGKSKLAGERKVMEISKEHFIIRASWMFGYYGENFMGWVLTSAKNKTPLKLITDNYGSPTYSIRLAEVIFEVLKTEKFGIYNFCNSGYTNWYEFGKFIIDNSGFKNEIIPITAAELKRPAQRPRFSAMKTDKIQNALNFQIPDWRADAQICIKKLNNSLYSKAAFNE